MRNVVTLVAGLALTLMAVGCKQTGSWEMAKEAFKEKDRAAVEKKLMEAFERAEEQIEDDPKEMRPYMVKGSVFAVKGQFQSAVETYKAALEDADLSNEKQRDALHEYILTCYYLSKEVNLLKAGAAFAKKLLASEGRKDVYYYYLGLYNLELYDRLGDGFYKSEANRYFDRANIQDSAVLRELGKMGIPDPMLD
jgi:tetratricopeptide (TPR) repeat protein